MSDDPAGGWKDLVSGLLGVARDYVGAGVRISVKTNYTPEIHVATAALGSKGEGGGQGSESALARLFGVKAAVIVRNETGQVISTFGDVPDTDPVRALLALGLVAGVGFLIVRGIVK